MGIILMFSLLKTSNDGLKSMNHNIQTKKSIDHHSCFTREFYCMMLANIVLTTPAYAEAGKIFDFNATLPAMAAQFLILMVFLDKTWFGPVGKVLDERDAKIRARLSSVKVGGDELETLREQAETLLKVARAETQAKISDAKEKAGAKAEAELA